MKWALLLVVIGGCSDVLGVPDISRYWVENEKPTGPGGFYTVDAICNLGDWVIAGGCWTTAGSGNLIVTSTPGQFLGLDGWRCQADGYGEGVLHARIECLHKE